MLLPPIVIGEEPQGRLTALEQPITVIVAFQPAATLLEFLEKDFAVTTFDVEVNVHVDVLFVMLVYVLLVPLCKCK